MWIYLNNAYLSIIDPDAAYGGGDGPKASKLLVRARFKGDIERVFPRAKVTTTPERDYRFRASIDRKWVAEAIAGAIENIDYKNFKGSTKEGFRHDAYAGCWGVMERAQRVRAEPKGTARKKQEDFWPDRNDYSLMPWDSVPPPKGADDYGHSGKRSRR
jgi:hypothetical protein